MDKRQHILETVLSGGLLPLYFHSSEEVSRGVLKALYDGGVRAVEYTNRGQEALANFISLKQLTEKELPGMYLGIGTVRNEKAAKDFIDAGADFIISPGIAEEVVRVAAANKILCMPGCMTPSEIMLAEKLGTTLVKLFPGNVLGPAFVSTVKDVFPGMLFMPTGGVDTSKQNLQAWFSAGVSAVGMGSKLLPRPIMEARDYPAITLQVKEVLKTIASIR